MTERIVWRENQRDGEIRRERDREEKRTMKVFQLNGSASDLQGDVRSLCLDTSSFSFSL